MFTVDQKENIKADLFLVIPTAAILIICTAVRMRFLQSILLPYTAIALLLSVSWISFLVCGFQTWVRNDLSRRSMEREKKRHPSTPQSHRGDSVSMGGPHWTEENRRRQSCEEMARYQPNQCNYYVPHPSYTYYPKGNLYRLGFTTEDQSTDDDSSDSNGYAPG